MPKLPQYTKEQVDKALEEIGQGESVRTAAKKYGVPRATLQFKLKHPTSKNEFGPEPYLSREEEAHLEQWLCEMGKRGFPRNADDILDSVQKFLNKNPRETPFHENRPGKGWLKGFLKRHPRITQRTGEAVTQASACVSESDIRNWFSQIRDHLSNSDLMQVLDDPSRIFNADESGFQTCPSTGKVFAEKGEKNVYIVDKGRAKENVTVLFAVSADGQMVLPTIVYPYQRLPDRIKQTVPDNWGVATSSSGWMTADTFKYIIEHIFYPYLVKNNIQLPVLLFVDGHKSHLTYELSVLAHSLQIEIFALYPNATRILQPADVSLFRPVKQFWKTAVREWLLENISEVVSKQNFALVLKKVTEKISPACIVNGFRACGLYPFNPDAVDYSKCLAKPISRSNGSTTQNDDPEKTLKFSEFKEIVGTEMINKFEDIKNVVRDVQNNESFFTLYRLWDHFNENKQEDTTKNDVECQTTNATSGQVEDISAAIISNDETNHTSETLNNNENHTKKSNVSINIIQNSEQVFEKEKNRDKNDTHNTEHENNNSTNFHSLQNDDTDLITLEDLGVVNTDNLSINLPSCSKTNLRDFLTIPPEPTRKGKRNIERLPYHISGQQYQQILESKTNEKRRIEEEKQAKRIEKEQKKEERKRKLEEIKKNKLEKKNKMHETRLLKTCCGVCKRMIKNIKLRCGECQKVFHKTCIPKSHHIHIPQEEGDGFLCHTCFCMENDDSNDSRKESEESDDEDEDFLNLIRTGQKELGLGYAKI